VAPHIPCDGWWHQPEFGRQPMLDLRLHIAGGRITGAGRDIVGRFTLAGTSDEQGRVAMIKRYIDLHTVEYEGQYDGEGLLWGLWHIGPLTDRWMIKIARTNVSNRAVDDATADSTN
jgi:hypothetical protein